ncbi:MAG: serine hydrolase, partial [Gemmatimonadota bacterium]
MNSMPKQMLLRVSFLILPTVLLGTCSDDPVSPITIQEADPITDIDGNAYPTIQIGDDIWMAENLTVSHFRNGDLILEARTVEEWIAAGEAGIPAWCYYENDPDHGAEYGRLYNWYAVVDPRGLEPQGWRVPGYTQWEDVIGNLGGGATAGKRMKSTTGWNGGQGGNNTSHFSALPGGGRASDGSFVDLGTAGVWWSRSEESAISAAAYSIVGSSGGITRGSFDKTTGLSVRAVYCPSCTSDTTQPQTLPERLQEVLDSSLETGAGIGLSAAVILPDGEIWRGTSGISHGTTEIAPDMRFAAGSIGKMFTAAAILQLAEEGSLTLDDSLNEWLPDYPHIDNTITIRQLLNHTGGINDFVDHPAYWDSIFAAPSRVWTPAEIVTTFAGEPLYPKGTAWNYSTTGYNLLRIIIMQVTGSALPEVYQERFWDPLGLTHSLASLGDDLPTDLAHGWYDLHGAGYEDFSSWPRVAFASGIGGEVWTTAEDLALWSKALLIDKTVVGQVLYDQMLTLFSPCTGEEFFCAGFGLGVALFNPDLVYRKVAYGHSGNAPGYAAVSLCLPDLDVC